MARRLPRGFFSRPSPEVARDLLGHRLVRRLPGGEVLAATIVETEAYEPTDPASHSFRGLTPRNRSMFGPPGHLYVYLVYGMHHCMNVVTRAPGEGSAVLLRAARPEEGVDAMRRPKVSRPVRDLCRGPGRWSEVFGVNRSLDGEDLVIGHVIWLERGASPAPAEVACGPRIGVRGGEETAWRFWIEGDPWVSGSRRT